jgi:hypothetical protein
VTPPAKKISLDWYLLLGVLPCSFVIYNPLSVHLYFCGPLRSCYRCLLAVSFYSVFVFYLLLHNLWQSPDTCCLEDGGVFCFIACHTMQPPLITDTVLVQQLHKRLILVPDSPPPKPSHFSNHMMQNICVLGVTLVP